MGIVDDVTNLSLPEDPNSPNTAAPGTIECKFWGLGGDGTGWLKDNSVKIIGDRLPRKRAGVLRSIDSWVKPAA